MDIIRCRVKMSFLFQESFFGVFKRSNCRDIHHVSCIDQGRRLVNLCLAEKPLVKSCFSPKSIFEETWRNSEETYYFEDKHVFFLSFSVNWRLDKQCCSWTRTYASQGPKMNHQHDWMITLPETSSSHQGSYPKRKLIFQPSIFRGYVSFREGNII